MAGRAACLLGAALLAFAPPPARADAPDAGEDPRARLAELDRLVEADPMDPLFLNLRAWRRFAAGLFAEAAEDLDLAMTLALTEDGTVPWVAAGFIKAAAGDLAGAERVLGRALAADGGERAGVRILRGLVRFRLGDRGGAFGDLERSLLLGGAEAMARKTLGAELANEGRLREARTHLNAAARLADGDPEILYDRARASWGLGDGEDAVRDLDRALDLARRDREGEGTVDVLIRTGLPGQDAHIIFTGDRYGDLVGSVRRARAMTALHSGRPLRALGDVAALARIRIGKAWRGPCAERAFRLLAGRAATGK